MRSETPRRIARVALGTLLLLAIPWIAMRFSEDMAWSPFDFAVVGTLLFCAGLVYVLATRQASHTKRVLVGLAVGAVVLVAWIELAVGIFGTPLAGS